jgi:hypothetical protein
LHVSHCISVISSLVCYFELLNIVPSSLYSMFEIRNGKEAPNLKKGLRCYFLVQLLLPCVFLACCTVIVKVCAKVCVMLGLAISMLSAVLLSSNFRWPGFQPLSYLKLVERLMP